MVCASKVAGIVLGSVLGAGLLFGLIPLLGALHLSEKRARRKLSKSGQAIEAKTVIVENRGPVAGEPGTSEIVTTGPAGTETRTVTTGSSGTAVVSTTAAGIPGGTAVVGSGETKVVKAEHPVGKPEKTTITTTTKK